MERNRRIGKEGKVSLPPPPPLHFIYLSPFPPLSPFPHSPSISSPFPHSLPISSKPGCKAAAGYDSLFPKIRKIDVVCCKGILLEYFYHTTTVIKIRQNYVIRVSGGQLCLAKSKIREKDENYNCPTHERLKNACFVLYFHPYYLKFLPFCFCFVFLWPVIPIKDSLSMKVRSVQFCISCSALKCIEVHCTEMVHILLHNPQCTAHFAVLQVHSVFCYCSGRKRWRCIPGKHGEELHVHWLLLSAGKPDIFPNHTGRMYLSNSQNVFVQIANCIFLRAN